MKLENYFYIEGTYELKDGLYNVSGDVTLVDIIEKLPCSFGSVSGDFKCSNNMLTSLEGAPKQVGGDFNCSSNNLTSLEGSTESVAHDFFCHKNNLTSLKGFPKYVGVDIICDDSL